LTSSYFSELLSLSFARRGGSRAGRSRAASLSGAQLSEGTLHGVIPHVTSTFRDCYKNSRSCHIRGRGERMRLLLPTVRCVIVAN
jgi:hypothetical protein